MIAKRSKKKGTKIKNDRMSLLIFWVAISLGLSTGFVKANYNEWDQLKDALALSGLGISVTGMIFRWISIIPL